MSLQPSEYDIQREVEALRDLRRRSTTPGALAIDPDLPNQSPPSSPTAYYKPKSPGAIDSNSATSSQEAGSSKHPSLHDDQDEPINPNNPADDPFHLFWVPASVHPEIAPAEFRAFLKEHARNPASDGSDPILGRAPSLASRSSLSRKRSMLSRQYQPKEGDDAEKEEKIVPLRRNRSIMQDNMPQLTISDLQRLEELAEEASQSDDPSKLRNVLRRSLSLQLSPTAIDKMDDIPDIGDEADSPIIVPPPGQILRRAARTKIRKPGLPGDGFGHRFGASRRGRTAGQQRRTSLEGSQETSESEGGGSSRRQTISDDGIGTQRPDSFSEEASSIFDAYVRDDDEELPTAAAVIVTTAPTSEPTPSTPYDDSPKLAEPEIQPSLLEALGPILEPQPQRLGVPQPSNEVVQQQPSRTPSPAEPVQEVPVQTQPPQPQVPHPQPVAIPQQPRPSIVQQQPAPIPSPPSSRKEKEKDKKGLFKWGSDKSGKKGGKGQSSEKEKEKEGFFGSLFGGKKKHEESSPITNAAGREAAHALLGASKSSKNHVPPPSPGLVSGAPYFARYPIHVERAIYRLSHIKLANPRRPLYEQVLISNLMFWYLGVINKAQTPTPQPAADNAAASGDKEDSEKEQKEREAREKAEKERLEKERLEKEQREREMEMKKKESGRRGSLTKTPAGGPVGRRAEMPVKGPQYDIQQQNMQKEYNGFNNGKPGQRPPPMNPQMMGNGPPPNGVPYRGPSPHSPSQQQFAPPPPQQYPPGQGPQPYPPPQGSPSYPPQQYPPPQHYPNSSPPRSGPPQNKPPGQDGIYYQTDHQQRPGLPPGAMPPMGMSPPMNSPPPHMQPLPMGGAPPMGPPPHQQRPPQGGPPQHPFPPHQPMQPNMQPMQPMQGPPRGPYPGGPPQQDNMSGNPPVPRAPTRSLSATAAGPPPMNGANLRKGHSAHAVAPYSDPRYKRGPSEEEDVPLAVYQQQQRR